jgi:hypothetical protein
MGSSVKPTGQASALRGPDADLKPVMHDVALNRVYQGSVLQSGQSMIGLYDRDLAALR